MTKQQALNTIQNIFESNGYKESNGDDWLGARLTALQSFVQSLPCDHLNMDDYQGTCDDCGASGRLNWIPASVGCHWSADDFYISTWSCGKEWGYMLLKNRNEIGSFPTLEAAQAAAEAL